MKKLISLRVTCWRKLKFWIWLEHLLSHTNFQEYNICCMVDRNSTRELWHMPCHWHIICSVPSCNVCSYCGSARSPCGRIQPRENTRNLQLPVSSFYSHHFIPRTGKLCLYGLNWLLEAFWQSCLKVHCTRVWKHIMQCRLVVICLCWIISQKSDDLNYTAEEAWNLAQYKDIFQFWIYIFSKCILCCITAVKVHIVVYIFCAISIF
jgi:hypothetical protein